MAFFKEFDPKNIIGIDIYLEGKKSRLYVGRLKHKKEGSKELFDLE